MSDEQQVIRDLAREFIAQKGDELWKLCCENYRWNSADVRKQNVVMIGLHLGFQAALSTSVAMSKKRETADTLPTEEQV